MDLHGASEFGGVFRYGQNVKPEDTFTGKKTGSKNVTRFYSSDLNDPRFAVAARTLGTGFGSSIGNFFRNTKNFVKLQVGDHKILLNINSLLKRLPTLTREQIKKAEREGNLKELLAEAFGKASKMVEHYNQILVNFDSVNKKSRELRHRSTQQTYTSTMIAKAIVASAKSLSENSESFTIESGYKFHAKLANNRFELTHINQILGGGSFGVVSTTLRLHETTKAEDLVLKQMIEEKGREDIENEFVKLMMCGNEWGIQAKPESLVNLETQTRGFLGIRYDYDYHTKLSVDPPTKEVTNSQLKDIHQLLYGLSHLDKSGILNGDIKPQNVLTKGDHTHIADFGAARSVNDDEELFFKSDTRTPLTSSLEELGTSQDLMYRGGELIKTAFEKQISPEQRKQLKELNEELKKLNEKVRELEAQIEDDAYDEDDKDLFQIRRDKALRKIEEAENKKEDILIGQFLKPFNEKILNAVKSGKPEDIILAKKLQAEKNAFMQKVINEGLNKEQLEKFNQHKKALIDSRQKGMVLAMGATLYMGLAGKDKEPYDSTPQGFINLRSQYKDLTHVNPELNKLIKSMVDKDPSKRPSAKDAMETFNKYLSNEHPQLMQKIESDMMVFAESVE